MMRKSLLPSERLSKTNSIIISLLLGIAEQSQALSAAVDANSEEKQLLSRILIKTKKAQSDASDLQRCETFILNPVPYIH